MDKNKFLSYLSVELTQPSTWRGFVWVLISLGIAIEPEQQEMIIVIGMFLAGLIGIFLSDNTKTR